MTEIPYSMKPWSGGEGPPDDWDGGPVMFRNGEMIGTQDKPGSPGNWMHPWIVGATDEYDVVAYTPKPQAARPSDDVESLADLAEANEQPVCCGCAQSPSFTVELVSLLREAVGDYEAHNGKPADEHHWWNHATRRLAEIEPPADPDLELVNSVIDEQFPNAANPNAWAMRNVALAAIKRVRAELTKEPL